MNTKSSFGSRAPSDLSVFLYFYYTSQFTHWQHDIHLKKKKKDSTKTGVSDLRPDAEEEDVEPVHNDVLELPVDGRQQDDREGVFVGDDETDDRVDYGHDAVNQRDGYSPDEIPFDVIHHAQDDFLKEPKSVPLLPVLDVITSPKRR